MYFSLNIVSWRFFHIRTSQSSSFFSILPWLCYLTMLLLNWVFPGGSYNAGDESLTPGLGRSSGEGNDNPLQYSCLRNPMDRGASRLQSMTSQELDMTQWLNNYSLTMSTERRTNTVSSFTEGARCVGFPTPRNAPIFCRYHLGVLQFSVTLSIWSHKGSVS